MLMLLLLLSIRILSLVGIWGVFVIFEKDIAAGGRCCGCCVVVDNDNVIGES